MNPLLFQLSYAGTEGPADAGERGNLARSRRGRHESPGGAAVGGDAVTRLS